jgi:hypothetical protein
METSTSSCAGLIEITPVPEAEPSAASDGVPPGVQNKRDRVSQAKWASCSVGAGAFLGIAATVCDGMGAISTRQSIALGVPAVILIVTGLTAAAAVSEVEAACRGFHLGLQVGSTLSWLRSVGSRNREL